MGLEENQYIIGVSSGMFNIAAQEEKEQYLTILRKVFWGAQKGVNFTQLDLESITEFNEPFIDEQIKKLQELGIEFGIHGETAATTREHTMPLDSAVFDDWWRAQERLLDHINGSAKIKAKYLLTHASESMPMPIAIVRDLELTKSADFLGRPMDFLLTEEPYGPKILDWAINQQFFMENRRLGGDALEKATKEAVENEEHRRKMEEKDREKKGPLTEEEKNLLKERVEFILKQRVTSYVTERDQDYGSQRISYLLIAKYMEMTKDPLWVTIVGNKKIDDIHHQYEAWVPAVSAKYIWGHFNPLPMSEYKRYGITRSFTEIDPKKLLEKNKIFFVFEPQMAQLGYEKYMRLHSIVHIHWLVRNIDSPWVGVAFDVEHTLSGGWDPKKLVNELPYDGGKFIKVMHLGWPTSHVPAHIPIYLGSEAQQYLYEILYGLRKKGFDRGWLIFERGGGQDPVKDSVVSLRKIVEFLLKDTPPKELPLEFYGVGEEGPEVKRQELTVKEHALDPLKGLLHVPEEEFGILSTAAAQRGKLEEWKKEKFK